jgi:chromosome segregation ATPase
MAESLPNTAQEGLSRIKTNLSNCRANLTEYQNSLKAVEGNLSETAKAKNQIDSQVKQVLQQDEENKKSLFFLNNQEKELSKLIADETILKDQESKKILEYETLLTKIRDNQKKREENISSYQDQNLQLQEEKKIWQARALDLKAQQDQVRKNLKAIATEEKEWKGKQLGYQSEVKRWSAEVERQQKLNDSYSSLSEVK